MHWTRQGYVISDDPARHDVDAIHRFLEAEIYRAFVGKPFNPDSLVRSIKGALGG
jgi:hypothetical protein